MFPAFKGYYPSKSYHPAFAGSKEHRIREGLLKVWDNECQKCHTEVDFYNADLHHLKPAEKRFTLDQRTIESILRGEGPIAGTGKILTEAAKCALVCKPCHVEVHKTGRLDLRG